MKYIHLIFFNLYIISNLFNSFVNASGDDSPSIDLSIEYSGAKISISRQTLKKVYIGHNPEQFNVSCNGKVFSFQTIHPATYNGIKKARGSYKSETVFPLSEIPQDTSAVTVSNFSPVNCVVTLSPHNLAIDPSDTSFLDQDGVICNKYSFECLVCDSEIDIMMNLENLLLESSYDEETKEYCYLNGTLRIHGKQESSEYFMGLNPQTIYKGEFYPIRSGILDFPNGLKMNEKFFQTIRLYYRENIESDRFCLYPVEVSNPAQLRSYYNELKTYLPGINFIKEFPSTKLYGQQTPEVISLSKQKMKERLPHNFDPKYSVRLYLQEPKSYKTIFLYTLERANAPITKLN